jgi:hypothetical protein
MWPNLYLKVLVVGAGSPNADMVAEVLRSNNVDAEWTDQVKVPSLKRIWTVDIVYGIYLQTCSRYILAAKLLGKKTVLHFVGSDAYWYARETSRIRKWYWRCVLDRADLILYVSPHLEGLVGRKGHVLPFPIRTESFRGLGGSRAPERDVLYYCPSGVSNERIYRLAWIKEYAKEHPDETITLIGNSTHPANYRINLPNVMVIPYVQRDEMPQLYVKHRRLIRMTTEDGLPRMLHEAILAGLQVTYNGQTVTTTPKEREPENFAKSFRNLVGASMS